MFRIRTILFFLLVCTTPVLLFAQKNNDLNKKADSAYLKRQIDKFNAITTFTDSSLREINKIISLARKHKDKKSEADGLRFLGKYHLGKLSKYEQATFYFIKSLSISDSLKYEEGSASTNLQLGIISFQLLNFNESINYFHKILSKKNINHQTVATAHYLTALSLSELDNFNKAIYHFDIAIKEYRKLNNTSGVKMCEQFIGKMYINTKDYKKAIKYLREITDKAVTKTDSHEIVPAYAFLSTAYIKVSDYKNAIKFGNYAYKHINNADGSILYLRECVNSLHYAYKATGDFTSAYQYLSILNEIKDTLYNNGIVQGIAKIKSQYEYQQQLKLKKVEQEKKDILVAQELSKQKLIRNTFILSFAVMGLFALVINFQRSRINKSKKRSDELLLNILPFDVAEELKERGHADAKQFENVTVLFTDFKGFTEISDQLSPKELVEIINEHFSEFDLIMQEYGVEKIKTIGDAYMAVGGLPIPNDTNPLDVVNAAIAIQEYLSKKNKAKKENGEVYFEVRIGIHTGSVVAGIVGLKKFSYDVWGDTVNTASRMESNCEVGKINISETTYAYVKDSFKCEHRGKVVAKGKGEVDMYYVSALST